MKQLNMAVVLLTSITLTSCAIFRKEEPLQSSARRSESTQVQNEDFNKKANDRAASLTAGWPESSVTAAKEMVVKYGEPTQVSKDYLVWKYPAPFKRIIVHKEIYSNRFPLLHQTAVEHVVDYDASGKRIKAVWDYNGSVVFNRTRGEMSASGESEEMNVLSLNLANEIMRGRMSSDGARIKHGKETMNLLNGNKTAYTQTLSFGNQINTTDTGETITNKILWKGDTPKQRARQAQEEKPND